MAESHVHHMATNNIAIALHGTLHYILPVLHCLRGDAFGF